MTVWLTADWWTVSDQPADWLANNYVTDQQITNWRTNWQTVRPTSQPFDWLTDQLTVWLNNQLTDCSTNWSNTDQQINKMLFIHIQVENTPLSPASWRGIPQTPASPCPTFMICMHAQLAETTRVELSCMSSLFSLQSMTWLRWEK